MLFRSNCAKKLAKIGMLRQLLGTVQPGETAANDDGVLQFLIFFCLSVRSHFGLPPPKSCRLFR